jgi:hypothetical protein
LNNPLSPTLFGVKGEGRAIGILFLIPFLFCTGIILALVVAGSTFDSLVRLAALLSLLGIISTIIIYKIREIRFKNKFNVEAENDDPETVPVMLGAGGIYGLIMGLGIYEALTSYGNVLGTAIESHLASNPLNFELFGLVSSSTFRIIAFLVTVLPFIHGAILMFSNKWYKESGTNRTHFGLAFVFFIAVFLQTTLLYYAGVNVEKSSLFILYLWLLMVVNTIWLLLQGIVTYKILHRNDYFLYRWIPINFSTVAFLSVFLFISPNVFSGLDINENSQVNVLMLAVLSTRSVADYYLGWKDLYSKLSSSNSRTSHVKAISSHKGI